MEKQTKTSAPDKVSDIDRLVEAAAAKAAELAQFSNRAREEHRKEIERVAREYDRRIDRLEAVADKANLAIEAAQNGDAGRAAELIEEVYRAVFHECDGGCRDCVLREDMFADFRGKERIQTRAGSLCHFADAVVRPRRNVWACDGVVREAFQEAGQAADAEAKAKNELAEAVERRTRADAYLEDARRELVAARTAWAEVQARYR